MKRLRSPRATYVAAFLLGAALAVLLNWPARAALSPGLAIGCTAATFPTEP